MAVHVNWRILKKKENIFDNTGLKRSTLTRLMEKKNIYNETSFPKFLYLSIHLLFVLIIFCVLLYIFLNNIADCSLFLNTRLPFISLLLFCNYHFSSSNMYIMLCYFLFVLGNWYSLSVTFHFYYLFIIISSFLSSLHITIYIS